MSNARIVTGAAAAVVTACLAIAPAQAQHVAPVTTQLFLTWPGIVGPSTVPGHVGDIALTSYSAGISVTGGAATGGGAGAGKVTLGQVVVTKAIDKTSPFFFGSVATGVHTPTATITFTSGRGDTTFYTVTLNDVAVTSMTQSDSLSDIITETLTFSYASIVVRIPSGDVITLTNPNPT